MSVALRNLNIFVGIALFSAMTVRADIQPVIHFSDQKANFFPGSAVTAKVQVITYAALKGRLTWEFSAKGAVIARGEVALDLTEPGVAEVQVQLAVPDAGPDAAIAAGLRVSLIAQGHRDAITAEKPLWILGREPWHGRYKWLEQLNILVFDPDETSAPLLEEAGIPFVLTRNPDALADGGHGLVLIAEDVDFREYPGLAGAIIEAAASGLPVICLAPAGGEMELPISADLERRPTSVSLVDRTIVRTLDKRLDMDHWGGGGRTSVKSTIHVHPERDRILASIEQGADGWPWLELVFPAESARAIMCGFAIIEKWEETPAARHMFLRMLERVEKTNRKDVEE